MTMARPEAGSPAHRCSSGGPAGGRSAIRRMLQAFVDIRELTLICLIAVIILVMANANPYFFSLANFRAVAVGMAPTAIIVIGMAILLASGGFDLSVGSVMALSSTVVALLLLSGMPIAAAVLCGLVPGAVAGIFNGLLVTGLGINPLIATLGTMSIARGIALVLTEGFSVSSLPPAFGWIGKADFGGFPVIVLVALALVIMFDLAVRHTRFFRQVYFIGANEKAAMLSGIHVTRVRIIAYAITGILAALAGVLLASRLMSGTPTAGNGIELQVLAAAVIGGASLRGGEGTILGAFLGVVFVALVNNTMTMLAVSIYWQMIVIGTVLVCAVALDMLLRGRPA